MRRFLSLVIFIVLLPVSTYLAFAERVSAEAVINEKTRSATTAGSDADAPPTIVKKGVRIEFTVEPSGSVDGDASPIQEGEYADVQFRISDAASGAPVPALQPAAWITRHGAGMDGELSCREQISRHLQGLLSLQADIDLNKYFLLVMNNDRTISVIDPLLGVNGITQLYAMIVLKERGEDWARSNDGKQLFVTMPRADAVAVVDLEEFQVIETLEIGSNPVRAALQPDGRYLWVGNDGRTEGQSGVTVVDAQNYEVIQYIPTGVGHHEIAFSDESLFAFVTNSIAGTVSVIDTQTLEKRADIKTGKSPVAVQYSPLSKRAYVASQSGVITVVDATGNEATGTIATDAGLVAFRVSPDGRWGFVANIERNVVEVIDTASGAFVHRFDVGGKPHQFAFTDNYAYVRHLGTPDVMLIPLAQLGQRATPGLKRIPIGNSAPGEYAFPALADAISPTGEWTAVVSANPADRMVYYYMEGMIAPMGSYSAYGRVPRAVGVVDRSLREVEKGVYGAKIHTPRQGSYRVAFLVDSPAVHHCFSFNVEADPQQVEETEDEIRFSVVNDTDNVAVGEPFMLRFSLNSGADHTPVPSLEDVTVLATRPPFNWQVRQRATPVGNGLYEVELLPDVAGIYLVSVSAKSLGLDFTDLPYVSLRVTAEGNRDERQGSAR